MIFHLLRSLFKPIKNSKGFSIVQAIMAAGALSVASIGLIQLKEDQTDQLVYLETKQEETAFIQQISLMFLQEAACTNSFDNTQMGTAQTVIRTPSDVPMFQVNTDLTTPDFSYGGGAFKIGDLQIVNDSVPAGGGTGRARLQVTFLRLKKRTGVTQITKEVGLIVETNASNNIIRCHTDISGLIGQAKADICVQHLRGTYDTATGECNLDCNEAVPTAAVSAACLESRVTTEYDTRYLPKSGGTLTGNLIVNSNLQGNTTVTGTGQVCVGSNCRDFSAVQCSSGIVRGVNPDGSLICVNVSCASAGLYFEGLDSSGNAICKKIPTDTCPAGQYAVEILPNGDLRCETPPSGTAVAACPAGQYISSIAADGSRTCATDEHVSMASACPLGQAVSMVSGTTATCVVVDRNVFGRGCVAGQYLNGFTADGNPICIAIPAGPTPTPTPVATATPTPTPTGCIPNLVWVGPNPEGVPAPNFCTGVGDTNCYNDSNGCSLGGPSGYWRLDSTEEFNDGRPACSPSPPPLGICGSCSAGEACHRDTGSPGPNRFIFYECDPSDPLLCS